LVSPVGSVNNEPTPPLALAYISASLKQAGYKVSGIDATGLALGSVQRIPSTDLQYNGLDISEILEKIDRSTTIIGVSATFSHDWNWVRDSITEIKNTFPKAIIIGGGEHFTALPEYCLRDCQALDYVCIGEGEATMVDFCKSLYGKKLVPHVQGIAFISEGQYIETPHRERIRHLDEIPWPDWDAFNIEPYLANSISFGASFGRNMPMLLSRGCPYKCTFCSNPNMWTTRYYLRSVEDVVREIKYYQKKYQITGVQFYDLTAVVKKSWIIDFCRSLINAGIVINWSLPSGTRSEALDEEVLNWLAQANLRYLVYAPESASTNTLKAIKKMISFPKMEQSIRHAIHLGITIRTNFIIGFPKESRKELYKTLQAQLKLSFLGVDEAPLFPFQPYPGTELFQYLIDRKKITLSDKYFDSLATFSNGRLAPPDQCYSEHIGRFELFFYRLQGTFLSYFISYVVRPRRIIRTLSNVLFKDQSATVFEQRIKDFRREKSMKV
jgi:radical SAM superfamily enzyme YgiQ (UPF0313 family)